MKSLKIKIIKVGLILFTSVLLTTVNNAQTPADDPILVGGSGPGGGVAPAGDGSPIVPFDNNMTLLLLTTGVAFASIKVRKGYLISN